SKETAEFCGEKRHCCYFMCGTTLFQNPATARTAGSCERIGATKAPVLSPAFFRPPVHFQKHGNPPTEVGPIVVGKPHVILPFDE
ncbi:MrpA C-terminal/MbhD domain-containing protein, partial [Dysosmobacter welbionis]